jgi:catechol 2,3-dioxygenase-like lactoylglutathione lyase family enzyme
VDIEHIGYVVEDPRGAAKWYVENLGLRVVRSFGEPGYAQFLADSSGHVMIEIYASATVPLPDYRAMNLLTLHLAFEADDVEATRLRLLAAGATPDGEITYAPNGDVIAVVRDPWGFPVQLARRSKAMI